MNKFVWWFLQRQIHRERRRQIRLYGYSRWHDEESTSKDPAHLIVEAYHHFERGHLYGYIQALALLQAQKDLLNYEEKEY